MAVVDRQDQQNILCTAARLTELSRASQLVVRCLAVRDRASSIPIALLVDYYLLGICTAHHSTFRTRDLHRVLDYNGSVTGAQMGITLLRLE